MKKFTMLSFLILAPLFSFANASLPNTQTICPDCKFGEGYGIPTEVGVVEGNYNFVRFGDGTKIQIPDAAVRLAQTALTHPDILEFYFYTNSNYFDVRTRTVQKS